MKKFWGLVAAAFLAFAPATAYAGITGTPTDNGTIAQPVAPGGSGYANYAGARSTLLVVKSSPGILAKIWNTNTTAQSATFTCYDNASAASGTVLWAGVLPAAGYTSVIALDVAATNGITCNASAATVSGNGINISYF